ncbi:recombinase family protein [Draconibacterium mangrovi]|uniref:recombinase family protein n=1 Tax=Draconibacterium mangrovi TaxID=2697469 RepID=UPI0013D1B15C|nr:recombinase family protein [Draconibacterium mangrovi]
MKAILLVRVSSDTQEYEEQKNDLIKTAIDKQYSEQDLIIVEHEESAIKLTIDERQGIIKLKKSIAEDKSINAVFVWELSRLARNQTEGHLLKDFFFKNKIQFYCTHPEIQLFNDSITAPYEIGDITFSLFLQMTESEMRTKKARFHRSKIRNAKTGKYSGGFIKYGYTVDDNGYYQIKDDEAELIRYVFNRYEAGISVWKLNKEIVERGLHNSISFVNETLKCEAYTGLSNKYGMNRVYPQIISVEQFNRVKELKKKNNKKLDKSNEIYFGKGLIKCNHCGAKYLAMKSSIQYLCYNRFGREQKINPTLACRESASININVLDTILFEASVIEETYFVMNNSKDAIKNLVEQINVNKQKIDNLRLTIEKSEAKKERNNTMYFNGGISEEKYLANVKNVDAEVKEATNAIVATTNLNTQLENRINDINTEKRDLWTEYRKYENGVYAIEDLKEKQKIVQRHIKEVEIIDEIPNHTKIVMIYFHMNPKVPLLYRVHFKKIPQLIEICTDFYDDGHNGYNNEFISAWGNNILWQEVDFKIEKRFVRNKAK